MEGAGGKGGLATNIVIGGIFKPGQGGRGGQGGEVLINH